MHVLPLSRRLKDVLFLDLALDLAARTALQGSLEALRASTAGAPLSALLAPVLLALQHVCLSGPPPLGGDEQELLLCLRQLKKLASQGSDGGCMLVLSHIHTLHVWYVI